MFKDAHIHLKAPNFTLHENEINVHLFSLKGPISLYEPLLSPDEIERANRYYFDKHRQAFIIARGQVRTLLGQYLKINPKDIVFQKGKYGKLFIKNDINLFFNLSHSEGYGLLGVGQNHELGIDIEKVKERDYLNIAHSKFSPQEIQDLNNTPPQLQKLGFYHIWAQKEALIKACGLGLHYPLHEFDTAITLPYHGLIWDSLHQTKWQMRTFMPLPLMCAAICCHQSIQDIHYYIESKHA